jgi:hypothetical protein
VKALVVVLLLLVVPVVEAQTGRMADSYVRISAYPDFEYRGDEDVRIAYQVRVVRGSVPTDERPSVRVVAANGGEAMPLKNGNDGDLGRVEVYPSNNHVNFGRLEPGLYEVLLVVEAEGLGADYFLSFDVIQPPVPYKAILLGKGREGRFILETQHDNFTVEIYRDGPGGRTVLDRHHGNSTTMRVPYVRGEQVKVEVRDENGWLNYANKQTDFLTGRTTYGPWVWNPDYEQTRNYQLRSWQNTATAVMLCLMSLAAAWWVVKRR